MLTIAKRRNSSQRFSRTSAYEVCYSQRSTSQRRKTSAGSVADMLDDLDARWGRIDAPCSRNGGLGEIDLRMDFATYRAIEEARRRTTG